jgi:hypothetical protein
MNDCCGGGMQLMADQYIRPGARLIIHSANPPSDFPETTPGGGRPARVVWCRRCPENASDRYVVGVQFVYPLET